MRRRFAVAWAVALLAGAVASWLLVEEGGQEPAQTPAGVALSADPSQADIDALVATIAAHTPAAKLPIDVQAPPARSLSPADSRAASQTRQPPDGYSFAVFERAGEPAGSEERPTVHSPSRGPAWLEAPDALPNLTANAASAGRDWSFGWVRLRTDAPLDETARALVELGVVVEGQAGRLLRSRLPGDPARLREIAALPGVDGLGAPPPSAKLPEPFAAEARERPANEVVPVFVTLAPAGEADGRWRGELERLGAVVGAYDPDTRTYAANVRYGALDAIAAADFIAFVEPVGFAEAMNDTAVPAMGADAYRQYTEEEGFQGTAGETVAIGVMDTGLNVNHVDIGSGRQSICGANFIDSLSEEQDLWFDADGHGTHVTATIAGTGAGDPRYAGMAPLVRHIRFAKVLDTGGGGWNRNIFPGMDFLAQASACEASGWADDAVRAPIVNMSLSANSLLYDGREAPPRKLDAVVWNAHQLYVVANANADARGFSNYATAKNSLAVGAAWDSGELGRFSSYGPTADGRLAPHVVGTGVEVMSASGAGRRSGYNSKSGTSMSSPSVAGVAALVMDAQPEMQWKPALVRAHLMASAIRPHAWLHAANAFPADNTDGPGALHHRYGLGKVSATTSLFDRRRGDGWRSGGWHGIRLDTDEYDSFRISVPEGASRLDVVLTWDEQPADVVADTVLNDLDLWLDVGGDCGGARCGERSSRSRRDNVEWVIVENPEPGPWRAKVVAERVYGDRPRAALAYTVIRGPSTPRLSVVADRDTLGPGGSVTVTVSTDGYVAAGVRLAVDCRLADGPPCRQWGDFEEVKDGGDGPKWIRPGSFISLGEIRPGKPRTLRLSWPALEGSDSLHFTVTGWNAAGGSAVVFADEVADGRFAPPDNDDFLAAAELLDSAAGDLLLATTEPGETPFDLGKERPAASVWYRWRASVDGPVHFTLATEPAFQDTRLYRTGIGGHPVSWFEMRLDVFEGESIAGARQVASAPWGASFFARRGREYFFRIAANARTAPYRLSLREGGAPDNDAFDTPVVLDGGEGQVAGTNAGATLEPGEFFGALAATVWYSWTAPEDGWYEFSLHPRHLKVLVFQDGAGAGDVRLVSALPGDAARFLATAGDVYRIAVASPDAEVGGTAFELSWTSVEVETPETRNDLFEDAEALADSDSGNAWVYTTDSATVEPGEPPASGVRTAWWSWAAPASGAYTWRAKSESMSLAAFEGDALESLDFVGSNESPTDEFSFVASEGRSYRFAAGAAPGVYAFTRGSPGATLVWGPTPANDAWSEAGFLEGAEGTLEASNRFATADRGERIWDVGHSSLWWSFEAPVAGWYRFWIDEGGPFTVAAYRADNPDAGSARLEMTASSVRGVSDGVEVFVYAEEEGVRFGIRVGTLGDAEGREFTLRWEQGEAPVWLRYAGRTAERYRYDDDGETVDVGEFRSLALDSTGETLYAASNAGLAVFDRAAEDGSLRLAELWPTSNADPWSLRLFWDGPRDRLLVLSGCSSLRAYTPTDDGQTLERQEDVPVSGDAECLRGDRRIFLDQTGSFLHFLQELFELQVFSVDEEGGLTHVQSYSAGLADATSHGDEYVYGVRYGLLSVLERDAAGILSQSTTVWSPHAQDAVAISRDDGLVFTWGRKGASVMDVRDPADPVLLSTVDIPREYSWVDLGCRFAVARGARAGVDAFCSNGGAYALEWRDDELALTDVLDPSRPNRYNDIVPPFGNPAGFAASPDGRHAYVSTGDRGILVFERVGNVVPTDQGDSSETARSVGPLPWSASDDLQPGGDRDVFRIDLPGRGVLTAHTDGGTDTFGTLKGADGTVRAADDDSGSGTNFEIEADLDDGTYYLEVRGYDDEVAGPYMLFVEFTAES
ncbi:MAG: S8 family serine peptidase [Gammaproteobacteria bacterium]|nr:S8 family serine peptidase [Gammaproteobacteria bacterium]